MRYGKAKKAETITLIVLGILVILIFMFPFYIAIAQSFKTQLETAYDALALPGAFRPDNYYEAVEKINFSASLRNSLIVTVSGVLLIVLCSSMSGYAIARNEGGYFKVLDRLFLSSIMVPFQVIMIPAYKLLKSLGLLNQLAGEIVMLVGICQKHPDGAGGCGQNRRVQPHSDLLGDRVPAVKADHGDHGGAACDVAVE